jgi:hypothetical protein
LQAPGVYIQELKCLSTIEEEIYRLITKGYSTNFQSVVDLIQITVTNSTNADLKFHTFVGPIALQPNTKSKIKAHIITLVNATAKDELLWGHTTSILPPNCYSTMPFLSSLLSHNFLQL